MSLILLILLILLVCGAFGYGGVRASIDPAIIIVVILLILLLGGGGVWYWRGC